MASIGHHFLSSLTPHSVLLILLGAKVERHSGPSALMWRLPMILQYLYDVRVAAAPRLIQRSVAKRVLDVWFSAALKQEVDHVLMSTARSLQGQ